MADSRSGGVWWLDDGSSGGGDAGESVYRPAEPSQPEQGSSAAGAELPSSEVFPSRHRSGPAVSSGRTDMTSRFPGWDSVIFEFPADEPPAPTLVPDQPRPEDQAAEADPAPVPPGPIGPIGTVGAGVLAGRKPSLLLMVAALLLVAGAVTGQLLAMLGGWGATYLSRRLGDFTKKFIVLGVPLITMTLSSVWYWGRAHGRWGAPLAQGTALSHATWSAAPAVLRVAAALSALLVLAITLRRRPNG